MRKTKRNSGFFFSVLATTSVLALLPLTGCKKEAPKPTGNLTPYPLQIPLGLEKDYTKWIPADNPLTTAKVKLGKMLYFDPRLSVDGTISCATCHNPNF
jgi:cytochrome c peroxidase